MNERDFIKILSTGDTAHERKNEGNDSDTEDRLLMDLLQDMAARSGRNRVRHLYGMLDIQGSDRKRACKRSCGWFNVAGYRRCEPGCEEIYGKRRKT